MPHRSKPKQVRNVNIQKKGRKLKNALYEKVIHLVDQYKYLYVLRADNVNTKHIEEVKQNFNDSTLLFGKNAVIHKALGDSESTEYQEGLHKLMKHFKDRKCALFSDKSKADVFDFCSSFHPVDFAKPGYKATHTVLLREGPLPCLDHSMEPALLKMGLPVKKVKGIITLERDYDVCKRGKFLTPDQCQVLRIVGIKLSEFRFLPVACWCKNSKDVEVFDKVSVAASSISSGKKKKGKAELVVTPSLLPGNKVIVTCEVEGSLDGLHHFVCDYVEDDEVVVEDADDEDDVEMDE